MIMMSNCVTQSLATHSLEHTINKYHPTLHSLEYVCLCDGHDMIAGFTDI